MKSNPTLAIPIRPHLKKFILARYKHTSEPFKITERCLLGRSVMRTLLETRAAKISKSNFEYTDRLLIIPTQDMLERSPRLWKLSTINLDLEKEFREQLMLWIDAQQELGCPVSQACKNYLAHHNIDNEYTWDACYKVWQRWREDPQTKDYKKRQQRSTHTLR